MLDEVIHQPVRLRIMASLSALQGEDRLDFRTLRDLLDLTDGNLGAHLTKLEAAGYITVDKIFEKRKPRTLVSMTTAGRAAFDAHVKALRELLGG